MDIRPIRTEADNELALQRIDALMDARPGTSEGDELDVLVTLVEAFEEQRYPIDPPEPIVFLREVMEWMNKSQVDLADLLGSRSRASEVLNRQRPLTLKQIRTISSAWNIPADPLIREYELSA